jgi:hypothetical protein
MFKRFGVWFQAGVYYSQAPDRRVICGFNPFGRWGLGVIDSPGMRGVAFGPFVVGRIEKPKGRA